MNRVKELPAEKGRKLPSMNRTGMPDWKKEAWILMRVFFPVQGRQGRNPSPALFLCIAHFYCAFTALERRPSLQPWMRGKVVCCGVLCEELNLSKRRLPLQPRESTVGQVSLLPTAYCFSFPLWVGKKDFLAPRREMS